MTAYTNMGQRIFAVKGANHQDLTNLVADASETIENQSYKRERKGHATQWIGFTKRAYTRPLSGVIYEGEGALVYDTARSADPTMQILDYQTELVDAHFNVGDYFLDSTGNANESGITILNTECTAIGDVLYGKWKDPNQDRVAHQTTPGQKPDIVFPTEFWPNDLYLVFMMWSQVNGVSIGSNHDFIARVQEDGVGTTFAAEFKTPAFFDNPDGPHLYIHIQELLSGSDPVPNRGNTGGIQGALEVINDNNTSTYHHWLAPNKIGFASPGALGGIT